MSLLGTNCGAFPHEREPRIEGMKRAGYGAAQFYVSNGDESMSAGIEHSMRN